MWLHAKQDAEIRTSLLSKLEGNKKLSMNDLTAECHRILNLKKDASILENPSKVAESDIVSVNAVSDNKPDNSSHKSQFNSAHKPHASNQYTQYKSNTDSSETNVNNKPKTPCWKCGQMHFVRVCPYQDHRCQDCQRIGHKEGYCQCASSNFGRKNKWKQPPAHTKGIYAVKQVAARHLRKFVPVSINNVLLELQLDCASDITVISEDNWNRIGRPPTRSPSQKACTASGQPLELLAETDCSVSLKGITRTGKIFVTTIPGLNLLGLDFIERFNLWDIPLSTICCSVTSTTDDIQWLRSSYPNMFTDTLGCCNKTEAKLYLMPDVQPVFRAKRPVPFAALQPIEAELQRLETLGIISPVEFSDWAAPIVAVKKNPIVISPAKCEYAPIIPQG